MSELCVFITAQSQLEVATFMSAIASRLSFLDVFYASLRWSRDQAPGRQAPAENRPLLASCFLYSPGLAAPGSFAGCMNSQ